MIPHDLSIDIYNAIRFSAADLCDVAAQRTALMTKVGDAWSDVAYRLRDDNARFVLGSHYGYYQAYVEHLTPPASLAYVGSLGGGALLEHLGIYGLPTKMTEGGADEHTTRSIAAIIDYLMGPALCTWVASAVATTAATWSPERDSPLVAAIADSPLGAALDLAARRTASSEDGWVPTPGGITQGQVPVIGATALAVRRILDHPQDGALIEGARCDLAAVLARLEATA